MNSFWKTIPWGAVAMVAVLLVWVSMRDAQAQDVAAGKVKYAACVACHGATGQGGMGPKLAGQKAEVIEKKLTIYKNKGQVGPQSQLMWGFSAGLTPADIKDIAAYTATLK
jgi:cytochrome c553